MTRYEVKIGDNLEVTYGWNKENAYEQLIERVPHYKFVITSEDLNQKGEDNLEEYLNLLGLDPFLK